MNNYQINNLASIGNTMQSGAVTMAKSAISTKQENDKLEEQLRKTQVNQVVSLFETYTMGQNGTLSQFTTNINENQLANFDANADEEVWNKAIDNINQITGGVYSEDIVNEALEEINKSSKSKYSMMKLQYKNTSMITALQSNFTSDQYLSLSATDENGNYTYDDSDGAVSAQKYINAYRYNSEGVYAGGGTTEGGFQNFGVMNKDGSFSYNGSVGKNIIATVGFNNHMASVVNANAMKGDMYTQKMMMDEIEDWGTKFCSELGMDSNETKAFIQTKQEEAVKALNSQKNNLDIYASEAKSNVVAMMDDAMRKNGYNSIAEIPITERVQMMEDAGLGDWATNSYSYKYAKQIVDTMYSADMQLHRKDIMEGLEMLDNGQIDGLSFDIDTLVRTVVSGDYGNRKKTKFSVTADGENFETSEEYTSEMNLALGEISRIYNVNFNTSAESETAVAPYLETMFGAEVDEICEKLGITDAYGKYTVAMHLENKISSNFGEGGTITNVTDFLDAKLKEEYFDSERFNSYVDYYNSMGYITDAQAQDYKEQKSFTTYKKEYDDIMAVIRNRIPENAGTILNNLETKKLIRDTILKNNGVVTQDMIDSIVGKLNSEYADEVTLDVLSKGLYVIANPDSYRNQLVETLSNGWNVSTIMGDYSNGKYNELGINSIMSKLRVDLEGIVGSTSLKDISSSQAEYICDTAWKLLGYQGKYSDSKDEVKKEVVEKATIIAMAEYAQAKSLQYQFGNSLENGAFNTVFKRGTYGGVAQVSLTGNVVYGITENGVQSYVVGNLKEEYRDKIIQSARSGNAIAIEDYMIEEKFTGGSISVAERMTYTEQELSTLNYSIGMIAGKNYRFINGSNGRLAVEKYDPTTSSWYNATDDKDLPRWISTTLSNQDATHVKYTKKIQEMPEYKQFIAKTLPWNK